EEMIRPQNEHKRGGAVACPTHRCRHSDRTTEESVMRDESTDFGGPAVSATSAPSLPAAVDRVTFQAELDGLRAREKAHTREGDAIAAARRRLPMVEVDANLALIGPD